MQQNHKRTRKILGYVIAGLFVLGVAATYVIAENNTLKETANPFDPASIQIAVEENGEANTSPTLDKSLTWTPEGDTNVAEKAVAIQNLNQGDNPTDAYIRVCLVPRWTVAKDLGDGETQVDVAGGDMGSLSATFPTAITGNRYTMGNVTFYLSSDWEDSWFYNPADGYFYYRQIVPPGEKTTTLLARVSVPQSAIKAGGAYHDMTLEIDVLSDAIQTVGGAVERRWGTGVQIGQDNTLQPRNENGGA